VRSRLPLGAAALVALSTLGARPLAQRVLWERAGPEPSPATDRTLFPGAFDAGEDVDGDGLGDVVVGAPYADAAFRGRVLVLRGRDGHELLELDGAHDGARLGWAVHLPGDLDGDGRSEIAASTFGGTVLVFSGRDASLVLELPPPVSWSAPDWLPLEALDADRDGVPDLVLASASASPPGVRSTSPVGEDRAPSGRPAVNAGAGAVAVVSGRDGALLWLREGRAAGDRFGWSVARLADRDGDGVDELLIGAPGFADLAQRAEVHRSYAELVSGRTGRSIDVFLPDPLPSDGGANPRFGWALAAGGDLDADGVADWLVAQSVRTPELRAGTRAFSGASRRRVECATALRPEDEGSRAGSAGDAVAFVGDVDGDGRDDFAEGDATPGDCLVPGRAGCGRVRLRSGCDGRVVGELRRADGVRFGARLLSPGDLDGNGRADLVVADPGWPPGTARKRGRLSVLELPRAPSVGWPADGERGAVLAWGAPAALGWPPTLRAAPLETVVCTGDRPELGAALGRTIELDCLVLPRQAAEPPRVSIARIELLPPALCSEP